MAVDTSKLLADLEAAAERTTVCRSCGAAELLPVLDLGEQPLANALRTRAELALPEPRYPLNLVLCPACSLVQITDSVPPELLFSDYPYFSSVIAALVEHARTLAGRIVADEGLGGDSLVVEIASNDGYLLQHYRDLGVPVLGVEPARNIASVARERGIPTLGEFFGARVARSMVASGVRPDVVHAHNVLAHVPDLDGFVRGIATLLESGGMAVIEAPYLKDLLDGCEFDTIYHEHLSYFSLTAIEEAFARHGMTVERVERIPIHGGSLRVFARRTPFARPDASVAELLRRGGRLGRRASRPPTPSSRTTCGRWVRPCDACSAACAREAGRSPATAPRPRAARCSTRSVSAPTCSSSWPTPARTSRAATRPAARSRSYRRRACSRPCPTTCCCWPGTSPTRSSPSRASTAARGGRFIVPLPDLSVL